MLETAIKQDLQNKVTYCINEMDLKNEFRKAYTINKKSEISILISKIKLKGELCSRNIGTIIIMVQ